LDKKLEQGKKIAGTDSLPLQYSMTELFFSEEQCF